MICVGFKGRLGNQLFQYAACRSLAENKMVDFHIPRIFLGNHQLKLNCYMGNEYQFYMRTHQEINPYLYDPSFHNLPDDIFLDGYFSSEKYFYTHKDKVKEWYKQPYNKIAEDFLKQYNINDYCYIHFRATDYIDTPYWLPQSYFDNAKNEIKKINSEIKFIIITDDVISAKNYFPDDLIFMNDIDVDFYLLSHSRYFITSNGSFDWWTIYLNDVYEKIIGPKDWLNYNHKLDDIAKGHISETSEQEKITYII